MSDQGVIPSLARPGQLGQFRSARLGLTIPISEGHNFFVRTPFRVFLDSIESSLSLEYNHILFNGIQYPHIKI